MDYGRFVVPLVKAVQQLSASNDAKDAKIDTLQNQLNDLKTLVLSIQQKQNQCNPCSASLSEQTQSQSQSVILSDASLLQQNIPNPFTNTTTIGYLLPSKFSNAQIVITDKNGKKLKTANVLGSGKGTLNIDTVTLAAGTYNYSLIIDGKLIETKQMVTIK